ncbi:hypothetical protein [Streptomyces sp. Sce081]|uniref:hypothetical protein n=1 Tax=Streptomyces sp. Sce081 TaxID=3349853 RepID=UPI0035F4BCCB
MSSAPQHPAPTPSSLSDAVAEDLQANLVGAEWTDDEAFAAYGLDDATITALRSWAVEWADDLASRLLEEADDPGIE